MMAFVKYGDPGPPLITESRGGIMISTESREIIVGNRLWRGRLLKKRNADRNNRIIRAATAKLEHEYEARVAVGTATGTFLEWLQKLPWSEIMKILAQLIPLFA